MIFDKFIGTHEREPTQAEIDKWISEPPDSRLDEIHKTASNVFAAAAQEYMAEQIKAQPQQAIYDSIDTEIKRHNREIEVYIRSATSFSRNFFPNIVTGIISSMIFAVVVILASLIFTKDPSPFAFYKGAMQSTAAPDAHGSPTPS